MKTLKELTDAQYALQKECNEYWAKHIAPRIEACKTRDEVRNVIDTVSFECAGENGQIREMPGHFSVNFALALSAFPGGVKQ